MKSMVDGRKIVGFAAVGVFTPSSFNPMPRPMLLVTVVAEVGSASGVGLWNARTNPLGSSPRLGVMGSWAVLNESAVDDTCLDAGGGDKSLFLRLKGGDGLLFLTLIGRGGVRSGVRGPRWFTGVTELGMASGCV